MPRIRRPILFLLGVPVVIGLPCLLIARNQESARKTALSVARAVHAEPAEDALQYGSHCYDLQDWLLLTRSGATALWASKYDSNGELSLWLPKTEREPVLRVLRDLYWGPPPSDADIEHVLSVALNEKLELHVALRNRLLPDLCRRRYRTTKEQRASVEKRVRFLATSEKPEERYTYAHSQAFSDTDCRPVLRKLLGDSDESTRAEAIRALGRRRDRSVRAILPALLEDPSSQIRGAAWSIQGRYATPELLATLWRYAKSEGSGNRTSALQALGNRRAFGKEHILLLRPLLHASDVEMRHVAVLQLAGLKDKESLPVIRQLLDSSDPQERLNGLMAIWWADDRESLPRVRQLAQDKACRWLAVDILKRWDPAHKPNLPEAFQFFQGLPFQGF